MLLASRCNNLTQNPLLLYARFGKKKDPILNQVSVRYVNFIKLCLSRVVDSSLSNLSLWFEMCEFQCCVFVPFLFVSSLKPQKRVL